jgi:Lrp/AsnC family transcriptional regulator for asnA, asnC and gidA
MPATTVSPEPLNAIDRDILDALLSDGRASHRDVAIRSGHSLATVNRRIRGMEERGVIKGYVPVLDASAVGWAMTVMIGLRIEKGHLRPVQQAIAKDSRVFAVYDVTGEWDGVVLARVQDRADLDDLAKTTLSQAHIMRTNSMVVLSTVLESGAPLLPV